MAAITLQPELQAAILQLGEQVELHGEDGKLLGFFVSPNLLSMLQIAYAKQLISDEELERIRKQSNTRTTAQVLERLAKLERGEQS